MVCFEPFFGGCRTGIPMTRGGDFEFFGSIGDSRNAPSFAIVGAMGVSPHETPWFSYGSPSLKKRSESERTPDQR